MPYLSFRLIHQNQNDIKALQNLVGNIAGYVPVGTLLQGLYATAPTGFLLCNGQEVAIESFPELYAVIGTLEGCQSENEGMFKVPDFRGRFLEGANGNLGKRIEAGLPNIDGTLYFDIATSGTSGYGALSDTYYTTTAGVIGITGNGKMAILRINASKSNKIYGKSKTVQPPAVCVNYIIKY